MSNRKQELNVTGKDEIGVSVNRSGEHTTIDVRSLPPPSRHSKILEVFDKIKPGEKLLVINDHEPVHLVQFMKHERRDFDASSYTAYQRGPREWIGEFHKNKAGDATHPDHIFTSFERERAYSEDSFSPVPIYSDPGFRVILTYIKAGQFIPIHSPGSDLVFLIHKGKGTATAGEKKYQVGPGDILIVKRGVKRGIMAETDMEAMHLVTPPPADKDHEEVSSQIAQGKFE